MASAAALRVSRREFQSLWEGDDPDLVLDSDQGSIRPVRRDTSDPSRLASVVGGVGKAVATATPIAIDAIASASRWD